MVKQNLTPYGERETVILGIDPGTNVLGYGVLKVTAGRPKMEAMGVIDLHRCASPYLKLGRIYERVAGVIDAFLPDELAIEAPFFGKNVQSMLKLGRAQGVAIAAAISFMLSANFGLYKEQKIVYSKIRAEFINRYTD